jgi:hypothetical protein
MSKSTFIGRLQRAIGNHDIPSWLDDFIKRELSRNNKPPPPVKKETIEAIRDLYHKEGQLCAVCPFLGKSE